MPATPFQWHGDEIAVELPGAHGLFTSAATGDLALTETDSRARLAGRLGLEFAWTRQVHGDRVHRVAAPGLHGDGDGVVIDAPGLAGIVLAADCLPILISDGSAVAAVHAGWPGLAKGVIASALAALPGPAVAAAIGPGAGPCCYEVGDELRDTFRGYDAEVGANLDLKQIARRQLGAAGVQQVDDVGLCTICDERFFSYRRQGERAGRQAGIAWLSS